MISFSWADPEQTQKRPTMARKSINPVFQKAIKDLQQQDVDPNNLCDDDVTQTHCYSVMRELVGEKEALCLARDAIRVAHRQFQASRIDRAIKKVFSKQPQGVNEITLGRDASYGKYVSNDASVIAFFQTLVDMGIGVEDSEGITLRRRADADSVAYSYRLGRRRRRRRFSHSCYGGLVGGGHPKDSAEYQAAKAAFEQAGLDVPDLEGGYLLTKTQMRSAAKDGVYKLVLEPGDPDNQICSFFKAKLYQFPFDGAQVPVISFPPEVAGPGWSGDKYEGLIVSDDVIEVVSMSQMLKTSILNGAQTPAIVFGLVEALQNKEENAPDPVLPKGMQAFG